MPDRPDRWLSPGRARLPLGDALAPHSRALPFGSAKRASLEPLGRGGTHRDRAARALGLVLELVHLGVGGGSNRLASQ